jgi:hypothetical protein
MVTSIMNVGVVVYMVVTCKKHTADTLLILHLSAADSMMGTYLLILAGHDIMFQDTYIIYALKWMWSWHCQVTGIIGMISSEASILFLSYISLCRFLSIVFSDGKNILNMKRSVILLCFIWILCVVFSSLPVLLYGVEDFYGSNGMCLPLYIQHPYTPGWKYSAVVLIGLNSLSIIFVIIFYVCIVRKFARSQENLSGHMSKEAGIARRVFLLVATDALCWIPIIILKTMALGGIYISPTVNGWVSVFILPINSALNPILYSLLTPQSIKFINGKCGWL